MVPAGTHHQGEIVPLGTGFRTECRPTAIAKRASATFSGCCGTVTRTVTPSAMPSDHEGHQALQLRPADVLPVRPAHGHRRDEVAQRHERARGR